MKKQIITMAGAAAMAMLLTAEAFGANYGPGMGSQTGTAYGPGYSQPGTGYQTSMANYGPGMSSQDIYIYNGPANNPAYGPPGMGPVPSEPIRRATETSMKKTFMPAAPIRRRPSSFWKKKKIPCIFITHTTEEPGSSRVTEPGSC